MLRQTGLNLSLSSFVSQGANFFQWVCNENVSKDEQVQNQTDSRVSFKQVIPKSGKAQTIRETEAFPRAPRLPMTKPKPLTLLVLSREEGNTIPI